MKLFFFFVSLMVWFHAFAQPQIVVQNSTSASVYTDLQTAVSNAADGDHVYLPGAYYNLSTPLIIDKGIHLIGAGFHPDSTKATGFTRIAGNIYLVTGADDTSLEGFENTGEIRITEATTNPITNLLFRNLKLNGLNLNSASISGSLASNITIDKCIINNIDVNSSQFVTIENNIITARISQAQGNCTINQNIFLTASTMLSFCYNSIISNNIIEKPSLNSCNYNVFYNNLTDEASINFGAFNTGSGNIYNVQLNTVFTNYPSATFTYGHDFHLLSGSAAIGAGINGEDLGIYGGADPYKEGSVPHNPHIQFKLISGTTTPQGLLNVEMKGRAQEN